MLPKALSNGICSLNENELRLAFSCLMRLDKEGNLTDYRFVKSIIRSRVKGVYSDINDLLAQGSGSEVFYLTHRGAEEPTLLLVEADHSELVKD